jgi:hypothetical protein
MEPAFWLHHQPGRRTRSLDGPNIQQDQPCFAPRGSDRRGRVGCVRLTHPSKGRESTEVGRSAAQCEPPQPLTSDGPPLTAPTRPVDYQPRDQEQRGSPARGSITNRSAKLNHIFPLQRETQAGPARAGPASFYREERIYIIGQPVVMGKNLMHCATQGVGSLRMLFWGSSKKSL